MIDLIGTPLPALPVDGLEWVRDLDRHDGPLLVQLRHPRGDHYLYYWCDCDDNSHRWMLARVSETSILRLVNKVLPLDRVIPKGCLEDFVYFLDTSARPKITMVSLDSIPAEYHPGAGAYIDVPESSEVRTFSLLIEESLTVDWIGALPRTFTRVYAALYALFVLKPQEYSQIPWREGFGGQRFYAWLIGRIPGEDRPSVDAFQYASPGFIRFSLDRNVAEMVSKAVRDLEENEVDVNAAYSRLYAYIKDNKLKDLNVDASGIADWEPHNPKLFSMTRGLLDAARLNDNDALLKAATPFEAAKVSLSFIRRIRELRKFEKNGIIRLPRPQA